MVRHTFRIAAFGDAMDLFRHDQLLLLHYLEVADDVDCGFRRDEGELVELLVFKELVLDLDDALLSEELAGKVDADGDLVFNTFQVEYVQCLVYIFSGYMVQYGTILQCAYYQFFSCHDSICSLISMK